MNAHNKHAGYSAARVRVKTRRPEQGALTASAVFAIIAHSDIPPESGTVSALPITECSDFDLS
ncbi:hypothetical protein K8Z49_34460 [Actinomadura madurae]|uniref:hypothetical protein n=1 Tax=Actinomadura madurae TaxID=1993 RepID=UPI00399A8229